MIAAIAADRSDITPYEDGTVRSIPWTPVAADVGEPWAAYEFFESALLPPGVLRIAWEVIGRRSGVNAIVSVGSAVVDRVDNLAVVREVVETHSSARVRIGVLGPFPTLEIQSHATEAWGFQLILRSRRIS